jgi:hypothetical protein
MGAFTSTTSGFEPGTFVSREGWYLLSFSPSFIFFTNSFYENI